MPTETAPEKTANSHPSPVNRPLQPGVVVSTVIHRVCIQCNNMFRATPDHFDAKQCPNCHKG